MLWVRLHHFLVIFLILNSILLDKNLTPKFDKQTDVYSKLQLVLDDAIANMGKAGKLQAIEYFLWR